MSRPRLLLINPNTSEAVTAAIAALAREEAGEAAEVVAVTARFGAAYIATRAAAAIAAHAVLDAAAEALGGEAPPDAIVLGCFGDPGLEALRELTPVPCLGFAGTGLAAAAREEGRFLIATSGAAWCAMLGELAAVLGLSPRVAGILDVPGAKTDPDGARAAIAEAAARAGASQVVLGGAGLIPVIPRIAQGLPLPLLDPHRATIREALASLRAAPAAPAPREAARTVGLSPALARLLGGEATASRR